MAIRTLGPAIVGGAALGLVLASASIVYEADLVRAVVGGDPIVARHVTAWDSADADMVDALTRANDCQLPAGTIPGHAVVTIDGVTKLVDARIGFAMWLGPDGVAGTGDETPGTLHAFCR